MFLKPGRQVISKVYDSTLFDHLDSTWDFAVGPAPTSTWLTFSVDFGFKSPLYRHIAAVFFEEVGCGVKRVLRCIRPKGMCLSACRLLAAYVQLYQQLLHHEGGLYGAYLQYHCAGWDRLLAAHAPELLLAESIC